MCVFSRCVLVDMELSLATVMMALVVVVVMVANTYTVLTMGQSLCYIHHMDHIILPSP